MPSYPADLSVPNPTQWYEKGGEMLLFGIRDVETLREADLCWNVAQFYAIAEKSNSTLQQAEQTIKAFEDLCNQQASKWADQDPAYRQTLRDLGKQRQGLHFLTQRLQNGMNTTIEEFKKEQGTDNDSEMEIIEDVTLEVVEEGSDANSEENADTKMDGCTEVE